MAGASGERCRALEMEDGQGGRAGTAGRVIGAGAAFTGLALGRGPHGRTLSGGTVCLEVGSKTPGISNDVYTDGLVSWLGDRLHNIIFSKEQSNAMIINWW